MGKKKDSENIRVVIRVRPMSQRERETCKEAVVLDLGMNSISVNHAVGEPDRFTFDSVYNNTFQQRQIYNNEVRPLVQSVLDGYNATVFAYGQSGSGKTFTMTGVPGTEMAGLMPNALDGVFKGVRELETTQKTYKIKVSYLELYNGKARDLFAKKQTNLEIKQNASKNFYVKGLDAFEVSSTEETLRLFEDGTERRKTASTDLNEHSSRSHALFTVHIVSTDHESDAGAPVVMTSKLNLCDLAGSERQSKTNTTGDTLKEGCNINLSLSALGTVIDTLVKGKGHVPYRSSPLTMLLKDSLGGNSKTVMFANCGPADMNIAETISTLRFADRAKQIENKPVKNLDPKDQLIADLKEQIEDLKKRLARGGGGDLEKEQELESRIELLQVERDQEKQMWERKELDLEGKNKMLEKQVQELEEMAEKMNKDLVSASDERKVGGTQHDELKDQLDELKKMWREFFLRLLPEGIVDEVSAKQIQPQGGEEADSLWDRTKIQDMQDAFHGWFREERKRGCSQEESDARINAATSELQAKIKQLEQQHTDQIKHTEEEFQIERKRQNEELEGLAAAKASLENSEAQCARLKEKIRKDHDKFKMKLAAVQQQVEEKATEVRGKEEEAEEVRQKTLQLKEEVENVQQKAKADLERASQEREMDIKKQLQGLQQKHELELEKKEEEKHELAQKMKQMEIKGLQSKMRSGKGKAKNASGGGDGDGGDAANEGFVEDGDDGDDRTISTTELAHLDRLGEQGEGGVLSELHTQLRIQLALQRLRHQQQKQLDGLVARYDRAAKDARGKVTEEKMRKAMDALSQEKQEAYEALKTQKEKDQARIVKNVNKMKANFEENERKLQSEKEELEAEVRDLNEANQALTKEMEQLLEQVQTLHSSVEEKDVQLQRAERRRERELLQSQRDMQAMEEDLSSQREQIVRLKEKDKEMQDIRKEHELTKVSLKDQRGQVEAQRARLRNMEQMYQTEKERNATLRKHAEDAQARVDKTEEHYKDVVRQHGERMSKLLHERVEEERAQHQEELREQQQRMRDVQQKLKKAKQREQKAKQKFDEMVLENENLQAQFEEFRVAAFRFQQEKDELELEDNTDRIRAMMRQQKELRREQESAFTGRPPSAMRQHGY